MAAVQKKEPSYVSQFKNNFIDSQTSARSSAFSPVDEQALAAHAEKINLAKTLAVARGWRPEELLVAIERNGDTILNAFGVDAKDSQDVATFKNDLQNYRQFYIETAQNFRHPELIDHLSDPANPNLQLEISADLLNFGKEVNEIYTIGSGQKANALGNYFNNHSLEEETEAPITTVPNQRPSTPSISVDEISPAEPATVAEATAPKTDKHPFTQRFREEEAVRAQLDEEEVQTYEVYHLEEEEIPTAPPAEELREQPSVLAQESIAHQPQVQAPAPPFATNSTVSAPAPTSTSASSTIASSSTSTIETSAPTSTSTATSAPISAAASASTASILSSAQEEPTAKTDHGVVPSLATSPPSGSHRAATAAPTFVPPATSSGGGQISPATASSVPTSNQTEIPLATASAAVPAAVNLGSALGEQSAGAAPTSNYVSPQPGVSFSRHLPSSSQTPSSSGLSSLDFRQKKPTSASSVSPNSKFARLTQTASQKKRPSFRLRPNLDGKRLKRLFSIIRSVITKIAGAIIKLIAFFIAHPIIGLAVFLSVGVIAVVAVTVSEESSSNTIQTSNQAPINNASCSTCLTITAKASPAEVKSPDAPITKENSQFANFSFTVIPNAEACTDVKLTGACSAQIAITCKDENDDCPEPGSVDYQIPTNSQTETNASNNSWNYRLPTDPEDAFTKDGDLSVPFCNALMRKLNVSSLAGQSLARSLTFNLNDFFPKGYPLPIGNDYRLEINVNLDYEAGSN